MKINLLKKLSLLIVTAFLATQVFAQDKPENQLATLFVEAAEATDPQVRLKKAEQIVKLAPNLPEGYTLRGTAHLQLNNFENTVADMTKALQLGITDKPLLTITYKIRGLANIKIGKYDDAVSDLTKASEFDDKDFRLYAQRAEAYRKLGKIELAKADEKKAAELRTIGEYTEMLEEANDNLKNGNYAESVKGFTKLIDAIGDDKLSYNLFFLRGRAYYKMESYDAALADFNAAIKAKPDFYQAYTFRGEVYLAARQLEAALKDFNKALEIKPNEILALRRRGEVYYLKDDYDKAITDLSAVITLDPKYSSAWFGRADNYFLKGEYAKSLSDISECIRLDDQNPAAYRFRARVYRKLGKIGEAEIDERKATALDLRITTG